MLIENNRDGLKYFIYLISQNTIIPYINTDIRKIIWYYATISYILLHLDCNIILILIIIIKL